MARILPWVLLLLGFADRGVAIVLYGSRYISTDDAIIWAAAVDYGHGVFLTPYYYGQNYGPMLEALVAAPFIRMGVPPWWGMPVVTTVLGMLPYWSFTLWHIKHRRTAGAICFAILPVLLPVEFSLMTTMSRGFITGLAPLALLPWISDLRRTSLRSILTGVIISMAWYINPNSVIFTVGYGCWYILTCHPRAKHAALTLIGLVPGAVAHFLSQAWCEAHPDRIVHRLRPEQLAFDPAYMARGLSRLDAHFQWLMPLVWPIGSLVGATLIILLVLALRRRNWPMAIALGVSSVAVLLSLGIPKTHEGWDSVFFPLSRMFLALPLHVTWAIARSMDTQRPVGWLMVCAAVLATTTTIWKATLIERTALAHNNALHQWLNVSRISRSQEDAERLRRISHGHRVGLIVPLQATIWPQFRAYLYPILEPELAPTYLYGYERRYWQRDRFANTVVPIVMFVGGAPERWTAIMAEDPRFVAVHDNGTDLVHVLVGNTQPTDTVAKWIKERLGQY